MSRSIILLISACVMLVACNRSSDQDSASATASANVEPATVTATTDAGTLQIKSGSDLSVPADFPKDVHVPAGFAVQNVVTIGPTTSLVFGADQGSPSLMKDIESAMSAQGWTTSMSLATAGEGSMLAFSKSGRSAMYTLSMAGGHPQLTLQHTQEPK